jgi:hypothetical protein
VTTEEDLEAYVNNSETYPRDLEKVKETVRIAREHQDQLAAAYQESATRETLVVCLSTLATVSTKHTRRVVVEFLWPIFSGASE